MSCLTHRRYCERIVLLFTLVASQALAFGRSSLANDEHDNIVKHSLEATPAPSAKVIAAIVPSYATTGTAAAATFSPPVPSPTTSPRYLFVFGDSYTSTGFTISNDTPTAANPLGNPAYPGLTDEPGMENWLDLLTTRNNVTTLTYNFAEGGAAVNNSLTENANQQVPDFVQQTQTFLDYLAAGDEHPDYAPWTSDDSTFLIWFGRNDVYWKAYQDAPLERLDEVQSSFILLLTRLVEAGARKMLVFNIPPMWREPLWDINVFSQWSDGLTGDVEYWNENLKRRLEQFRTFYPRLQFEWLDIAPAFEQVLDHPGPYGAPDAKCTNQLARDGRGPGNGTDCLWADGVHPGAVMNQEIASAVKTKLWQSGLLS